nr:uncharacterized protein LOC127488266 [Oryctolagus cuniculus]
MPAPAFGPARRVGVSVSAIQRRPPAKAALKPMKGAVRQRNRTANVTPLDSGGSGPAARQPQWAAQARSAANFRAPGHRRAGVCATPPPGPRGGTEADDRSALTATWSPEAVSARPAGGPHVGLLRPRDTSGLKIKGSKTARVEARVSGPGSSSLCPAANPPALTQQRPGLWPPEGPPETPHQPLHQGLTTLFRVSVSEDGRVHSRHPVRTAQVATMVQRPHHWCQRRMSRAGPCPPQLLLLPLLLLQPLGRAGSRSGHGCTSSVQGPLAANPPPTTTLGFAVTLPRTGTVASCLGAGTNGTPFSTATSRARQPRGLYTCA